MRLLVLGAGGQVGHELTFLAGPDLHIHALPRAKADITDTDAVMAAVRDSACDAVINAAAYTAVDQAESDSATAFAVNRDGPAAIARACTRAGIPLVHLSTDYVFDGTKTGAYHESDPVAPINVYGASKLAGERAVADILPRHVIMRTSWVFAAHGRNFMRTMLRLGAERPVLRVVDDQAGGPTAAADIAVATVAIARRLTAGDDAALWGTYHYSGAPATTWYGFATAIFSRWQELSGQPAPRLEPVTAAAFGGPTRRPMNSVLDCRRIAASFGIAQPDWRRSLNAALEHLARP